MSGYNTEQRKILIDYMSKNIDTPMTIEELITGMQLDETITVIPGRSTIYRLINKLLEEGVIMRFVKGHSRHFYYQITSCTHCHEHIHMKCTSCGKLYHMDDEETEKIMLTVLHNNKFFVNKEETTLYGTCDACHK